MSRLGFTGFFIIACGFLIFTLPVNAVITANWGDVVDVRYSLYTDAAHTEGIENNVNRDLTHIYLSRGTDVPQEIRDLYSDAVSSFLVPFEEAFIGMEVMQEKNFTIDAADHDYGDELAGKNLYYEIILLEIVYDAAPDGITTSTTTSGSPSPPPDFGFLLAAGAGVSLLAGGFLLRGFRASQRMESAMSDRATRTEQQDQIHKKERSQLQELRELTETLTDPQDKTQEKDPVKIRRRR